VRNVKIIHRDHNVLNGNFWKMQFYKPNLIHFRSDSQLNILVIVARKQHLRNILKQSSDKTSVDHEQMIRQISTAVDHKQMIRG